ncbi:MAG: 50S ribosomal protein L29 [Ruminococcaceae bacterium]|nr:50S ribosomal protein L29 [Oscillospiraceae bacterium]MBQ4048157.1 50S ribosomal protein L29 [Clostridia bacterium]
MKAKDFKGMTANELTTKIAELKAELFNLRFQNATNQLGNPMRIVEVKKDIARASTVLRQVELSAQSQR